MSQTARGPEDPDAGGKRILFVSAPLVGHVLPLVPLARAFQASGHTVVVATSEAALAAVPSDLPARDIGDGTSFNRILLATMARSPWLVPAELKGKAGERFAGRLFGAVSAHLLPGLDRLAAQFHPDLIVFESLAAAGALIDDPAPRVLFENSLYAGLDLLQACVSSPALQVATSDGRFRMTAPARILTLQPPSMRAAENDGAWPIRPQNDTGRLAKSPELPAPERPRLLVTRSTVGGPGASGYMAAVVKIAADLDAEIVLAHPPAAVGKRAQHAANVRVTDWIPLTSELPRSAAIVHHGGSGTTLAALEAGVPQLVVRGAGDRTHNAEVVQRSGAGLAGPSRLTPALLKRLLTDQTLAARATAVGAEIAAMPAARDLVDPLIGEAR